MYILLVSTNGTYPSEYWLDKLIVPSSIARSGLFSIPLWPAKSSEGDGFINCVVFWEATLSAPE